VIAYLGAKRLLLTLDNFEHVAAAGPVLSAVLAGCPAVTALVTSRAALRLRGEHELRVEPLAVPPPGDQGFNSELARLPAIELFVQRARGQLQPGAYPG